MAVNMVDQGSGNFSYGMPMHKEGGSGGGGGMAPKYGPVSEASAGVGTSMEAETPEDTAKRTARNSEGGTGPGSATLLSGPPTSNQQGPWWSGST